MPDSVTDTGTDTGTGSLSLLLGPALPQGMEITLFYQKERKEFGRPVNAFAPSEVTVLEEFEHEDELVRNHVERNPTILDIQAKPDMSQQDVCASPRSRSPRRCPLISPSSTPEC